MVVWCGGGVVVWCGGAVVVRWWCGGGAVVVRWWCGGGAVVCADDSLTFATPTQKVCSCRAMCYRDHNNHCVHLRGETDYKTDTCEINNKKHTTRRENSK